MKKPSALVVGSGVSGLTAALLLAAHDYRVRLVEQSPRIGGALRRFRRGGVAFDTGFHFAGGLDDGGLLHRMLAALELADAVQPRFLAEDCSFRFVFESAGRAFDLPRGIAGWRETLARAFPKERSAVEGYFERVARVCANTPGMDLVSLGAPRRPLDEDYVTLARVLEDLTDDRLLRGVLCGLCMCHGVRPSEVSFATHSRVCYDLHRCAAQLEGGGDALIDAFAGRLRALNVEILRGRRLAACEGIEGDRVRRFVLDDGTALEADAAVLTIHPRAVLDLLPRAHLSRAFAQRVESFEDTAGFFTAYGVLRRPEPDPATAKTVVSLFPYEDFDRMMAPSAEDARALVLVSSVEPGANGPAQVVTAFEPAAEDHVAAWRESRIGRRPPGYADYKAARAESIRRRIEGYGDGYAGQFDLVESSSMLTFRDYLHSPGGSAYGIKQKPGQYNLIGRLPLKNVFVAGQSALLPGVAGAMMSAFFVVRPIVGRDRFDRFLRGGGTG